MAYNSLETHVVVIGAGFGGVSAAAYLAKAGYRVTVYEKSSLAAGRARVLNRDGFRFEMGASWYWLPLEYDRWFSDMGARREDYYSIHRLDPSYKLYLGGSLPGESGTVLELAKRRYTRHRFAMSKRKYRSLLGSSADKAPALYTLLDYIDFGLRAWYPEGGFGKVLEAMHTVAESQGVRFVFNAEVTGIRSSAGRASRVYVRSNCDEDEVHADAVVTGGDHLYVEKKQLGARSRLRSVMKQQEVALAPAGLNYHVGINRKLPSLAHRNFFCDAGRDDQCGVVHRSTCGPDSPLFFLEIPSITDSSFAPEGCEAMTIRIPCAAITNNSDDLYEQHFNSVLDRIEKLTGETLRDAIVVRETV